MKRVFLVLILVFSSMWTISPSAIAAVSDCVNLGNPSVSSTDTRISVQVSITVNCSNTQLGQDGAIPRYQIVEETPDTSSCTGPEKLQSGLTSIIRCSIQMGTSTGSIRTGAKSSTLKITFRSDSSFKLVPFSHDEIVPGGAGVCKVAPLAPLLSITYPDSNLGPRFDFTNDPKSDVALNFFWTYSTYDSDRKVWDPWNNLNTEKLLNGKGNFSFQSTLQTNKSKIAFYVYASNKCGDSPKSKETLDGSGIPLAGKLIDSATLKMNSVGILDSVNLSDLIQLTSNRDFSVSSRNPSVCVVSSAKLVPISLGNCLLSISSQEYYNVTPLFNFPLLLNIVRSNQTLTNFIYKTSQIGSPVTLPLKSDQGLDLIPEVGAQQSCVLDGNSILGIAAGFCTGTLKNSGNDKLNDFSTNFKVEITKMSQSIKVNNLSKGLVIKNKIAKLDVSATSKLIVSANNLTPAVCTYSLGQLKVNANGLCSFELVQTGDTTFSPAPKLTIKLTISNQGVKSVITCSKGNLVKQVSGSNPTCPSGYTKK